MKVIDLRNKNKREQVLGLNNVKNLILSTAITAFIVLLYFSATNVSIQNASGTPSSVSSPQVKSLHHVFFQDDYSSNTGWIQMGTAVTVNDPTFPGIVKFNNVAGGGTVIDNRVFKQLPSALPSDRWVANFDYKFTSSSIPDFHPFVFTVTSDNPQLQPATNIIEVRHGPNADQLSIVSVGSNSATIPISPGIQYYVTLTRVHTELELFVFSDPSRTIQVAGSPIIETIGPMDYRNLQFIQHDGCLMCGPARALTAEIDNTEIFTKGSK